MRERPILFSGEMVRAILDGRKTQTRRVVKPQPTGLSREPFCVWVTDERNERGEFQERSVRCPYGAPGDRLWTKEQWATERQFDHLKPRDIPESAHDSARCVFDGGIIAGWHKARSARFMPRWAARLTLAITDVRVQRVQDIEPRDCEAEGIRFDGQPPMTGRGPELRRLFSELWDSLNAKRGYSWDSNCWVWALTFTAALTGRGTEGP